MPLATDAGGNAVLHIDRPGVGVSHLDEQLVLPHTAVQGHVTLSLRQIRHRPQRVFQRVAQEGAQLRVGDRQPVGQLRLHRQLGLRLLRLVREGRAQQVHQLVFAEAAGRDRLDVRAYLLDVLLRLLRLTGEKPIQHIQVVAHIVLVDGGLRLHLAEGVHVAAGLLQLRFQHGTPHLRVRAVLHLVVEGGQEQDVERHQQRGHKFIHRLDAGVQGVGVHGGGVVEDVVGHRQAAEQHQRLLGVGHGGVGGAHQKAVEQVEQSHQQQHIRKAADNFAAGDRLHGVFAPFQRLAAQVRRAGADDGHAHGLFQHDHQQQHQRQVHQQRVELLRGTHAQHQSRRGLQHQKHRAHQPHHPLFAAGGAAAGDAHGQQQTVDQHQRVIEHLQSLAGRQPHYRIAHASLPENSSSK